MNLKKITVLALTLLATATVFAQKPVEISGTLLARRATEVKLFKVQEGKIEEIASIKPKEDKQFSYQFKPAYEGLYVVGFGVPINPQNNYTFYFKGGEKLSIAISDTSYVLNEATASKENIVLTKWHKLLNATALKSSFSFDPKRPPVDYAGHMENVTAKAKVFLTENVTKNPKFDALMKQTVRLDLALIYANDYFRTSKAQKEEDKYKALFSTNSGKNFTKTTAEIYPYPFGMRTLNVVFAAELLSKGINGRTGLVSTTPKMELIVNDTLKGNFVLEGAAVCKTYADYQALMKMNGKYILSKSQKEANKAIYTDLTNIKPGSEAYQFSYPDVNGKMVSMADFKGKIVLIDFWATWCGPCKEQIPYLKKLEEELKGTDFQAVSISLDAFKSKAGWAKMVKEQKMAGVQLFGVTEKTSEDTSISGDGYNTSFGEIAKFYKIISIPRFVLIDREGKIVSTDSARPSDPELKTLIEKLLTEK